MDERVCIQCGIEFIGRNHERFCSPQCKETIHQRPIRGKFDDNKKNSNSRIEYAKKQKNRYDIVKSRKPTLIHRQIDERGYSWCEIC